MADREKVIRGLERCLKHTCPAIDSKEYRDCEYTIGLYCGQDKLMRDALALMKEQEEREQRICKEICDYIRCSCSTDTEDDKDFVCYEIQKRFMEGL